MEEAVLSVLQGGGGGGKEDNDKNGGVIGGGVKVKKLRKMVLLSMQMDDDDKSSKKDFKRTVQALEDAGKIQLDPDGLVSLKTKGKNKKRKKKTEKKNESSSSSKRKRVEEEQKAVDDGNQQQQQQQQEDDEEDNDNDETPSSKEEEKKNKKNAPCQGNPQGVTRLFCGNLPFSVDETSLQAFFLPDAVVTHIRWITDKETGKFYGSAFIEMNNSTSAAHAVVNKSGQDLLGRPIKITYAPSRPGDVWPPPKKVVSGGASAAAAANSGGGTTATGSGGGQAGGKGIKAMSAKPDGCVKLFIGNLSYDIDDDAMHKFFGTVNAEVKALRWLHHKDTGDFKGCGYAEFWNTEACEKAATLNGKNLLGRPIRIDWTD